MEIGTVFRAAGAVIAIAQRAEVTDFFSIFCCSSPFGDLESTMGMVQDTLVRAEGQNLDGVQAGHVENLKLAVYKTEDLLDEFVTNQQQKKKDSAIKKVFRFFSKDNHVWVAIDTCLEYRNIKNRFTNIFINQNLGAFLQSPHTRVQSNLREDTSSHVAQDTIIGREKEVEEIVATLLGSNSSSSSSSSSSSNETPLSFLSIVGVGGMGKTAVAQLVYRQIKDKHSNAFPLLLWVCVSDHDSSQELDVQKILKGIIIESGASIDAYSPMQQLQKKVTHELKKQRFLLVLDDVWTEKSNDWRRLRISLSEGHPGSWIVVTTRSHTTMELIGGHQYLLPGLSMEVSWRLLKEHASVRAGDENLVEKEGKQFLQRSDRSPLTIRIIGGILYHINTNGHAWSSYFNQELPNNLAESETLDAHKSLRFSYVRLEHELKCCFTYCALFPKGIAVKKELLLNLWMAQGYINPPSPMLRSLSMETKAEQNLSALVNRSFFYEVKYDVVSGKITSFMIHDVVHDFATQVAGSDIFVTKCPSPNINQKVRHLAYTSPEFQTHTFEKTHIRSYHYAGTHAKPSMKPSYLDALFSNWKRLRELDFFVVDIQSLPESIGGLLHLRYLNLSNNRELSVLPKSISKLYNLQTLKIGGCLALKEVPIDFKRLVNLRSLEIKYCGIKQLIVLPQLNNIHLEFLPNLRYIEALRTNGISPCIEYESMENIVLWRLQSLTGWGNPTVVGDQGDIPLLCPELKSLRISDCHWFKCTLMCPKITHMRLEEFNEELVISQQASPQEQAGSSNNLEGIFINNMRWLTNMTTLSFQCLKKLEIDCDKRIKSLEEAGIVFRSCSASLESLTIRLCGDLENVMSEGLQHLNNLKFLCIERCNTLTLSEEIDEPSFRRTLLHLKLDNLPMLRSVPNWVMFLTALEKIDIQRCDNVEETNPI